MSDYDDDEEYTLNMGHTGFAEEPDYFNVGLGGMHDPAGLGGMDDLSALPSPSPEKSEFDHHSSDLRAVGIARPAERRSSETQRNSPKPNVTIASEYNEAQAAAAAAAAGAARTKRIGGGVGAVILALLLNRGVRWATHDKTLEDMTSIVEELPAQIYAVKEVIGSTHKCRVGGVYKPGRITGSMWRRESSEETCWVPVNVDFKELLKLSLGEANVNRILAEYTKTNQGNFPPQSITESDITIDQANELLDLLTLHELNANDVLRRHVAEMKKKGESRKQIVAWKAQHKQLTAPSEEKFTELRHDMEKMKSNPAARAIFEGPYYAGGTRRKRHKGRKTKKHHKSKQNKSTRRVRRKHQVRRKRKTRRKS
jgi:hypothetical protein